MLGIGLGMRKLGLGMGKRVSGMGSGTSQPRLGMANVCMGSQKSVRGSIRESFQEWRTRFGNVLENVAHYQGREPRNLWARLLKAIINSGVLCKVLSNSCHCDYVSKHEMPYLMNCR